MVAFSSLNCFSGCYCISPRSVTWRHVIEIFFKLRVERVVPSTMLLILGFSTGQCRACPLLMFTSILFIFRFCDGCNLALVDFVFLLSLVIVPSGVSRDRLVLGSTLSGSSFNLASEVAHTFVVHYWNSCFLLVFLCELF